jgi:hypothetical protein
MSRSRVNTSETLRNRVPELEYKLTEVSEKNDINEMVIELLKNEIKNLEEIAKNYKDQIKNQEDIN